MRDTKEPCAWCGRPVNVAYPHTRYLGLTLCQRGNPRLPQRGPTPSRPCGDVLAIWLSRPSIDDERNPPRPVTVYVPCD
jgi:hypothetical protein